jgi:hypothetical protein
VPFETPPERSLAGFLTASTILDAASNLLTDP